jgi:hypothetical protein
MQTFKSCTNFMQAGPGAAPPVVVNDGSHTRLTGPDVPGIGNLLY